MSQQSCYKLLKRNPTKWFSAKLANKKLRIGSAGANFAKLYKYGEVQRRVDHIKQHSTYEFRYK